MTKDELAKHIETNYGEQLTRFEKGKFDLWYEVEADKILEVCRKLHDDEALKFDFLCNISGIDTGEQFQLVYNLASIVNSLRLDLITTLNRENPEIESVQTIWPGANWHEREVWELFGINIKNHGNLKRFLLPDEWDQGYPMRKDWDAEDFIRLPEK